MARRYINLPLTPIVLIFFSKGKRKPQVCQNPTPIVKTSQVKGTSITRDTHTMRTGIKANQHYLGGGAIPFYDSQGVLRSVVQSLLLLLQLTQEGILEQLSL